MHYYYSTGSSNTVNERDVMDFCWGCESISVRCTVHINTTCYILYYQIDVCSYFIPIPNIPNCAIGPLTPYRYSTTSIGW